MHSLSYKPTPTVTVQPRPQSLPRSVALCTTLAFSISAASTALSGDYQKSINLKPATIAGPSTTNTVLLAHDHSADVGPDGRGASQHPRQVRR
jgi:hypothetical protein